MYSLGETLFSISKLLNLVFDLVSYNNTATKIIAAQTLVHIFILKLFLFFLSNFHQVYIDIEKIHALDSLGKQLMMNLLNFMGAIQNMQGWLNSSCYHNKKNSSNHKVHFSSVNLQDNLFFVNHLQYKLINHSSLNLQYLSHLFKVNTFFHHRDHSQLCESSWHLHTVKYKLGSCSKCLQLKVYSVTC